MITQHITDMQAALAASRRVAETTIEEHKRQIIELQAFMQHIDKLAATTRLPGYMANAAGNGRIDLKAAMDAVDAQEAEDAPA